MVTYVQGAVEPGGLIATTAATTYARFGYWPLDFVAICKRFYRGQVPSHVKQLAARLAISRPWERCAHGVDLTSERPYCRECMR